MPTVTFLHEDKRANAANDESLLTVCERVKATVPFSCQEGTCGTCIIEVKKGAENLNPLSEDEKSTLAIYGGDEAKHRLACQCRVKGDIEIDLP